MYRLLEVGEVIESGDEFWMGSSRQWVAASSSVGARVKSCDGPQRRLVKPAVTPAAPSVPDPGEGYRLVKNGEIIEKEDEWFENNQWRRNYATGCTYLIDTPLRRRIEKPAPVVSVGDRVKVLSGPWAGCTGVVIGSLPMNLKIKMDNVFVGGNNLTMIVGKTSSVEPLPPAPPVVPEVLFRDLAIGETAKAGDQFWKFGHGPWTVAGPEEIGNTISRFKARHRRPVRVQSPGWRYLDAGETVQAGDETFCENVGFWPLSIVNGSQVNNQKMFRRKLPANQGG